MKRLTIILGIIGLIIGGLAFIGLNKRTSERLSRLIPPQWKDFENLDLVDRSILQYDSVYGDYMQWVGTTYIGEGEPDSITWKLQLDKSKKFAVKSVFEDKTGFFRQVPGNISFSGQWTEKNGRLTLKFYFAPETWTLLFDSTRNENVIKFADKETIELDKEARVIWIVGTECKKS